MSIGGSSNSGVVLQDAAGKHYHLSPLTVREVGEVEQQAALEWRLARYKEERQFAEVHHGAERQQLLEAARERFKNSGGEIPPPHVTTILNPQTKEPIRKELPYWVYWMTETWEGKLYVVWLSARRQQPELSLDDLAAIFTDSMKNQKREDLLEKFADVVGELTMPPENPSQPSPSAEGATESRRRRRRRRT